MKNDPIVAEVRRIREQQAAKYNFDLAAIFQAAQIQQRESGRKVVSFKPRKRKELLAEHRG